nr:energy-coupling factor transporter transmembrane protein EcfT [Spelaeicoccus albus]
MHRCPVWPKVALIAAVSLAVLIVDRLWASGTLVVAALIVARACRLPWRVVLAPLKFLWIVLAVIAAYQSFAVGVLPAVRIAANIAACILTASLIMATTSDARLMDAVAAAGRPLKYVGGDPERFALTVAIMFRSIPYLLGSVSAVRDSAKARGLERSPRALVLPVVVGAVAYARRTGDALAARGLGELGLGEAGGDEPPLP